MTEVGESKKTTAKPNSGNTREDSGEVGKKMCRLNTPQGDGQQGTGEPSQGVMRTQAGKFGNETGSSGTKVQ